jgi:DNA-binding protein H-NS
MALNVNKMSIAELNQLISDAQTALAKKQAVAEKVRKLAHDNGLDISDLMAADKPTKAKVKKPRGKVAPKYKNPANGAETWTGRGRQPRWVADALNGGKSLDDLLI